MKSKFTLSLFCIRLCMTSGQYSHLCSSFDKFRELRDQICPATLVFCFHLHLVKLNFYLNKFKFFKYI